MKDQALKHVPRGLYTAVITVTREGPFEGKLRRVVDARAHRSNLEVQNCAQTVCWLDITEKGERDAKNAFETRQDEKENDDNS
jgi:hypothetical protein